MAAALKGLRILPLHEITDQDKLERLTRGMRQDGWIGRKIVALHCGDHLQAITGTHRLAAAEAAGVQPEVLIVEQPIYDGSYQSYRQCELWGQLVEGCDDLRLEAAEELHRRGEIDAEAIETLRQEIEE